MLAHKRRDLFIDTVLLISYWLWRGLLILKFLNLLFNESFNLYMYNLYIYRLYIYRLMESTSI